MATKAQNAERCDAAWGEGKVTTTTTDLDELELRPDVRQRAAQREARLAAHTAKMPPRTPRIAHIRPTSWRDADAGELSALILDALRNGESPTQLCITHEISATVMNEHVSAFLNFRKYEHENIEESSTEDEQAGEQESGPEADGEVQPDDDAPDTTEGA